MRLFRLLFLMMLILYRIFNPSRLKTRTWDLKISFLEKNKKVKLRTKRIKLSKRSIMISYSFHSILSQNTNTQTQNASKKSFPRILRINFRMNMTKSLIDKIITWLKDRKLIKKVIKITNYTTIFKTNLKLLTISLKTPEMTNNVSHSPCQTWKSSNQKT